MDKQEEFDYGAIIQSCAIQDEVMEETVQGEVENKKNYNEALQEYLKTKNELSYMTDKYSTIKFNFDENFKIKSDFTELQNCVNLKLEEVNATSFALVEVLLKNSDNFATSVNHCVEKIKNLSNEFDESKMVENKWVYVNNASILKTDIIKTKEDNAKMKNLLSNAYSSIDDYAFFQKLQAFLCTQVENFDLKLLALEQKRVEKQKNIEFLTDSISKMKKKYDA